MPLQSKAVKTLLVWLGSRVVSAAGVGCDLEKSMVGATRKRLVQATGCGFDSNIFKTFEEVNTS